MDRIGRRVLAILGKWRSIRPRSSLVRPGGQASAAACSALGANGNGTDGAVRCWTPRPHQPRARKVKKSVGHAHEQAASCAKVGSQVIFELVWWDFLISAR